MIRRPIGKRWKVLLGVSAMLAIMGGYAWMSYRQHQKNPDDTTIPNWSQLKEGVHKVVEVNRRSGERWLVEDLSATATRLFMGLAVGTLLAVVVGLLMGCFKRFEGFLLPILAITAKLAPTAMLAVFFVSVGVGREMYITMIAWGIVPTMGQSIYLAARDVPDNFLFKAYTLGASDAEVIWNVVVPMILPKMLDALRLAIGPAVVYLIAAEMVVSDVGFGYRIRLQMRLLNMNIVYPYLALLAAFGFSIDCGIRFVQRKACPWYVREDA